MEWSVFHAWSIAFGITYAFEVSAYYVLCAHHGWSTDLTRLPAHCLMVNLSTHPFIFIALPTLLNASYTEYVVLAEAIAILGESALLRYLGYTQHFKLALAANLLSWLVGGALYSHLMQ